MLALRWTDGNKLLAVGHNAVAVYDTFYSGGKKEGVIGLYDMKRVFHITKAATKNSAGASESVKMMRMLSFVRYSVVDRAFGKGAKA